MNKARFIRLHNAENNTVVILNVNSITLIDTDEAPSVDGKGKRLVSTIYTNSNSDVKEFSVNETPEKIYDMISALDKE